SALAAHHGTVATALDRATGGCQHRHCKSKASLDPREKRGDRRCGEHPRKKHCRQQQPLPREYEQDQSRDEWSRAILVERRPRRLEQLPVWNSARTHRLARPAAEALVDVLLDAGIGGLDRALEK